MWEFFSGSNRRIAFEKRTGDPEQQPSTPTAPSRALGGEADEVARSAFSAPLQHIDVRATLTATVASPPLSPTRRRRVSLALKHAVNFKDVTLSTGYPAAAGCSSSSVGGALDEGQEQEDDQVTSIQKTKMVIVMVRPRHACLPPCRVLSVADHELGMWCTCAGWPASSGQDFPVSVTGVCGHSGKAHKGGHRHGRRSGGSQARGEGGHKGGHSHRVCHRGIR